MAFLLYAIYGFSGVSVETPARYIKQWVSCMTPLTVDTWSYVGLHSHKYLYMCIAVFRITPTDPTVISVHMHRYWYRLWYDWFNIYPNKHLSSRALNFHGSGTDKITFTILEHYCHCKIAISIVQKFRYPSSLVILACVLYRCIQRNININGESKESIVHRKSEYFLVMFITNTRLDE